MQALRYVTGAEIMQVIAQYASALCFQSSEVELKGAKINMAKTSSSLPMQRSLFGQSIVRRDLDSCAIV